VPRALIETEIAEDVDVFDFSLGDEEMARLWDEETVA
jgi:hypothetical protein